MSKAEELAKELYPLLVTAKIGNNPYISYNTEQLAKQEGFVGGYHQAEKDNELTWEDIKTIDKLLNQCVDYSNPYQEVLKRFKAQEECYYLTFKDAEKSIVNQARKELCNIKTQKGEKV